METQLESEKIVQKASAKDWLGLVVIALPCALYSMDLTILNLATPAISADLSPSASQLLWIIDIYGFMVAGFLMIMGAMGDRYGRRRVLMFGGIFFAVATVLAAVAQTATQLIIARAILGIAGATIGPSTLSLISNMFRDEGERTFALSMWIASFSVGSILGPVVGGVILSYFSWGAVFLAGVPIMLILILLGPWVLPEYSNPDEPSPDIASALMSLVGVLAIIYTIKHTAEYGMDPTALIVGVFGVAVAFLFIRRQSRIKNPLVNLELFRSGGFVLSLAINVAAFFFMLGVFAFAAQYFQLVIGLTPLQAGLWTLPSGIAFTIMSFFVAPLAAKFSPFRVLAGGLLLAATGFLSLIFSSGLYAVVASLVILSCGLTPVITLATGFVVGAVEPEKAGMASGLSETASELGSALGIALLGSLLTLIYTTSMAGVVPAQVPAELAADLRTSLALAAEAVKAMPADVASAMLAAARQSFMYAFHAMAALACAVLALLAWAALRHLKGATVAEH
jgi:MFS transporter, DHA2 family, multidrug resistance protein